MTVTTGVSRPQYTSPVYLVRTPEQPQSLRTWLAQGGFGVPAGAVPTASVLLAPSGAEAAFADAALREAQASPGR